MPKLYVSNTEERIRLFGSDFLNKFTRVHWATPMVLYPPVVVICLYISYREYTIAPSTGALLFVGGMFVWTLIEYTNRSMVLTHNPTNHLPDQDQTAASSREDAREGVAG